MTKLYTFETSATSAQFILSDGSNIAIRFDDLTDDIRHALMVHGLKQKVVDAAAIPRDVETGRSASDADKITAMRAVADRITAGEWNAKTGEGGGTRSLLARALDILYPEKAGAGIDAFVATLDKKQQAALRMSPKVAPIIAGLRPAPKTTSAADDLLNSLL